MRNFTPSQAFEPPAAQTDAAQTTLGNKKEYHSPEFKSYGTVVDLTRADPIGQQPDEEFESFRSGPG